MAGSALAVVQPGDLGNEDTGAPAETTTTTAGADLTTTTTVEVATTASPATTVAGSATTSPGAVTTTTIAGSATTRPGAATTTTIAGSGLGVSGPPSGGADGTAETGGESMLGAGLGLLGLGLLLRRVASRQTA